jgi:hypothetical protein
VATRPGPTAPRTILPELIERGGEYACDARIQLADLHMEAGDTNLAQAELAILTKDPALTERHCEITAEPLATHGDLTQAARWYDRAATHLFDDQLNALRHRDGWLSIGTTITLRNRPSSPTPSGPSSSG